MEAGKRSKQAPFPPVKLNEREVPRGENREGFLPLATRELLECPIFSLYTILKGIAFSISLDQISENGPRSGF